MADQGETVLFVHAHPDDETISTGGTIAILATGGTAVTVLTCTRGELGEVVDPALTVSGPAELALVRERELASALALLGVTDHRFLGSADARWEGSARVYLDSGMQWGPAGAEPLANVSPDAFTAAPFAEVVSDIAAVIAELAPDAVIGYDERGGYGHPDHVRAGAAARRAAEVMGVPFFAIETGEQGGEESVRVDVASVLDRKREALRHYRSQLVVGDDWFAGANGEREPITAVESYRRVRQAPARADDSYAAQSLGLKIFTGALSVIFGAAAGLVLTAVHQTTLHHVPWPAIAGVLVTGLLLAGLRVAFSSRLVALLAAAGYLVLALLLALGSAGSSTLLEPSVGGTIWIYGTVVVAVVVLALPRFSRRRPG